MPLVTFEAKHGDEMLVRALAFATLWHGKQVRKGTRIPYVSHLLAVSSLALEAGGRMDLHAPAALLHDVVEDTPATVADVKREFGPAIASIVRACSDAEDEKNKGSWPERKARYIKHLARVSPGALLVSLSDKMHNAACILDDYQRLGPRLWSRFKIESKGAAGQLWYYRQLVEAFESRRTELPVGGRAVLDRLSATVRSLQNLAVEREPKAVAASYKFDEARVRGR
jgi:(p)ppGpp synthase/HD superfamily hydrolase